MGTLTPNANHNTAFSLRAFGARGGGIEVGLWTPTTLGAYTTVGEILTFASGKTPKMVMFQSGFTLTAPTTLGVDYRYDATNCSVRAFSGSTSVGSSVWLGAAFAGVEATTTFVGPTTVGIPYIAFSW